MLIYLLSFNSGKQYVGETVRSLTIRISQHRRMVNYGSLLPVHCAWRKHGEPNIHVLGEYQTLDELHAAECQFIAELGTLSPGGYNVGLGGETAPSKSPDVAAKIAAKAKGRVHSEEVKARIAQASKDRWNDPDYRSRVSSGIRAAMTDERRAAMSESRKGQGKGRVVSEATKKKMRNRVITDEARRRMSEAAKGKKKAPRSEETRRKIGERTAAAWKDPEMTARRVAAIKAAWTPEKRAAMAEKKRTRDAAKSSIA